MDQAAERAFTERASNISATSTAAAVPLQSGSRLFAGGGEVGAVLAGIDWTKTQLGPVETWPQTLRTSLRICLTSRHDIILWWGPDLLVFYNDAYAPTLGIHHPDAAGKPGREVWAEIWDVIGPMLEGVLHTGQPTWSYDQLLYLERHGYTEETYHTYSYSPIEDDNGNVGGVFTAVTETTLRVLAERRTIAARDLAAAIVDARTAEEVCARAASALSTDANDVPFAVFYLLDRDGKHGHLSASTGLPADSPLTPATVDLGAADPGAPFHWPFERVARTGRHEVVTNLPYSPCTATLSSGAHSRSALPSRAVVLPVTEPGQSQPSAIVVAGVNPHRTLDDDYERFYELLASHLASALASAHAYEEERRRAEALAAIDRAKTTFFSNVSHEFRTPLTLMLGPLEDMLARRAALPAAEREELDLIHRNGLRLLKLVNSLLDFARIEAGRVQASYEPTDLAAYTAELASAFRSLIEKAGMQLVVDCPPLADGDGASRELVYVDREMWEKIVLNLLSNAFKFTLEGVITVTLRTVDKGQAVELMVRDTGVGIPADELPRLFERFHRVEGMRARTHEGSGIGLALVQELVHLHAGTIHVESQEGAGATFFVRLPMGAAHLPAERVQAPSTLASTALGMAAYLGEAARWLPGSPDSLSDSLGSPVASTLELDGHLARPTASTIGAAKQRARIVLVDDNADMREYLARLLSAQYAVEALANGAQALAAIRRAIPDLVLSDVMMPELDGFGLLRELRTDPATVSVPVVLLSARAGEEATIEGMEAGADDYLVKPFSAREVLSRVAARLEIARSRSEAQHRTREALDALLAMAGELVTTNVRTGTREVAARLAALAPQVLGCEIVTLAGIDADTGCFAPLATVGRTAEDEATWYSTVGGLRPEAYFTANQLARLRSGDVIVVDVPAAVARGVPMYGTRATAVAPLTSDGTLVGILSVAYGSERHEYAADELELASGFAQMAHLVLQRERLLAEREGARAEALALVEATRRMDEFMGIASHELRTPLTSITANVQLAGRQLQSLNHIAGAAAGDRQDALHGLRTRLERSVLLLERTERQVGRMDRLVGDLLDASRIQAGKLELRPEPCDLLAIVRDAVQEQRAAWPKRSITLDLPRHASHATLPIHADADRIGQVVTNFLTNALKYSFPDQPVAVRVRMQSGRNDAARVEVRDQGPGLSAAQQEHLFERFYRVPGIEQQSGSGVGLGLGLHICKTIVERHSGNVGVESAPGADSTFWFTLPLATDTSAA